MKRKIYLFSIALSILGIGLWMAIGGGSAQAEEGNEKPLIVGQVQDAQNQPIEGAHITLEVGIREQVISEAFTQEDGWFTLEAPAPLPAEVQLHILKSHFENDAHTLTSDEIMNINSGEVIVIPTVHLERRIGPAFWIATLIFLAMLILIATGLLHNTLAALVGVVLIYAVSYLGRPLWEDLFIFEFSDSMRYIDWNVIFLIMGMMIIIAVVENTGLFQWLAFFAYRISRGRAIVLLAILMLITGLASAFLDNVTTMLLMTPITVQIALAMELNPLALLIPEIFASNVIGVSTLVGTPTNILIGSYAQITFNSFLTNLTPGVLIAFLGLLIYCVWVFRKDLSVVSSPSPILLKELANRGQITQPSHLKKAGVVGAGMLVMFVLGEHIHLLPSVTALMGATALLVWIRPDIEEMIEAVDWTTLVFFLSLFIVVGAIQEVGFISLIASGIGHLIGDNLVLGMLAVTWLSAILSMVVANIPFTAAMLPVVGYLSATIPGANSKVLFFCLSVGAAMGGNGTLIGASANIVTACIANSAGYPISYAAFFRKGFPALVVTVLLASFWLLLRF